MTFSKIIDNIVRNMADRIINEGVQTVEAGNNGPYYDDDTNVRNLAHWCVIFSEYYMHTGDDRMKELVQLLADAVIDSPFYNGNGVYTCRQNPNRDAMNGLIGPAWIIEGLIYATKVTGDRKYYQRALCITEQNPFNRKLGLWNRTKPDNKVISVDVTFNHQLWYAAALAMVTDYESNDRINGELDIFLKRLGRNFAVRKSGRISHFTSNDEHGFISIFGRIYRDFKSDVAELFKKPSMAYKENGYHSFNLYGFALLKAYYKNSAKYFDNKKFEKTLMYLATKEYYNSIERPDRALDGTRVKSKLENAENVFAFAYNSPAFELDRICQVLIEDERLKGMINIISREFKERQIKCTYDEAGGCFGRNTDDPSTLTARIYEYIAGNDKYFEEILSQTKGN